jgi:hypothetical protein
MRLKLFLMVKGWKSGHTRTPTSARLVAARPLVPLVDPWRDHQHGHPDPESVKLEEEGHCPSVRQSGLGTPLMGLQNKAIVLQWILDMDLDGLLDSIILP